MQHQSFFSTINVIRVPTLLQEALKDKNWVQAKVMNEEMTTLEKNQRWKIVNNPLDKRARKCTWFII